MDETMMYMPDQDAFDAVTDKLDGGEALTFTDVGNVFGAPFYELLINALMDSGDAARAIQGAINRLRAEGTSFHDEDDLEETPEEHTINAS